MKTLPRARAIEDLRNKYLQLVDEDHCLCDVAGREGIFCGGFKRYTSAELKERYAWILRSRPRMTRAQIEELANRWQLARQFATEQPLACDVQMGETQHRQCRGWAEFTEADLGHFYLEAFDEEVQVVPDEPATR